MSHVVPSQHKEALSSGPSPRSEERHLPREAKGTGSNENPERAALSLTGETPFGAIHVDASGIVVEHRPVKTHALTGTASIVGRPVSSIAPWASGPAFLSALKSAIESTKVSFHFDFTKTANCVERAIHVNILAAGDQSAWIFVSDKTLLLLS